MIDKLSVIIKEKVQIEDEVLFKYGLNSLLNYTILFVVTLYFSIKYNYTFAVILFTLFFVIIKTHVGGFHFDNKIVCFSFSLASINLFPIIIQSYPLEKWIILILGLSCSSILYFICPISSHNKTLNANEIIYFKHTIRKILFSFSIAAVIFFKFNWLICLNSLSFALIICTIDILLCILERRIINDKFA